MQYDAIAENGSKSEHYNIKGGGVERGFKSASLIHTTFGITFLSIEKFLKQRQNTR